MDKDGNLYLNGEKLNRKLYKHTTASYNYYGSPGPNELALISLEMSVFGYLES